MPYFPIYFPIYLSVDLDREKLVAFAVLVGCDYFPQGVRGVGEEKAKKLISAVNHRNLLERLFLTSHALQNEVKLKGFKQRRCLPKRKLSMLFIKRGKKTCVAHFIVAKRSARVRRLFFLTQPIRLLSN